MRLKHITYKELGWSLEGLNFNEVSLIVGKNAVGKSKSVEALDQLVRLILQKKEITKYDFFGYELLWEDDTIELNYSFGYAEGKIVFESLKDNKGKNYIERNEDNTLFFGEKINPPSNRLTLNVRRDTVLYPEIEEIIKWAECSYGLLFNNIVNSGSDDTSPYSIMSQCESLISMFEKLGDRERLKIQEVLNALNYPVDKLEIIEVNQKYKVLHIEEKDVRNFLWEGALSQGMQRALFLIVFINFAATRKDKIQTVIIDDFCEGLDYDRAIKLGKYLYSFCLEHGIQLITTSNDSFLMDVVELKYWNILQRDGEKVFAINMENSPQLFDDFEFTGLSNFDLFSSDFIARHKRNE